MVFGQGHGIAIGSEMSGNVLNVTFTNLTLDGTQRGVRVKSQLGRGGIVSDITYEKMVIRNVEEAINVNEFYSSGASGMAPIFKVRSAETHADHTSSHSHTHTHTHTTSTYQHNRTL
jgi:polygalacturonase